MCSQWVVNEHISSSPAQGSRVHAAGDRATQLLWRLKNGEGPYKTKVQVIKLSSWAAPPLAERSCLQQHLPPAGPASFSSRFSASLIIATKPSRAGVLRR